FWALNASHPQFLSFKFPENIACLRPSNLYCSDIPQAWLRTARHAKKPAWQGGEGVTSYYSDHGRLRRVISDMNQIYLFEAVFVASMRYAH
ncbi:hypothetical protein, partial [Salmonella enterica]|uniref:hypothetical protein n=1 Tax=Salmonella enterica TaxID=28901 RepID=UPI001482DD44